MTANDRSHANTTDQETAHLVSMANDIAANLRFQPDAATRIAQHIRRSWAPRMRTWLMEYAHTYGSGLNAGVRAALEKL